MVYLPLSLSNSSQYQNVCFLLWYVFFNCIFVFRVLFHYCLYIYIYTCLFLSPRSHSFFCFSLSFLSFLFLIVFFLHASLYIFISFTFLLLRLPSSALHHFLRFVLLLCQLTFPFLCPSLHSISHLLKCILLFTSLSSIPLSSSSFHLL